ncbi:hypothetical protein OUZ56_012190 [Daphnia magna]|uniref:Uncharacterized protein n=1 Tax=Daphnia magna TaxID=35525 RepID=A0ABQ9Z2A4_9CRUS|nr:hypothetical protein OUZ56_012190 [Daphnia magna]
MAAKMASNRVFNSSFKKCVFIEIFDGAANMPYQVFINEGCATGKSDIELIVEAMVVKKPSLGPILKARGFYFTIESEFKQGKWITLGEKETVVEGSELRLMILNNIEIIEMDQSTELTFKESQFISSTLKGTRSADFTCSNSQLLLSEDSHGSHARQSQESFTLQSHGSPLLPSQQNLFDVSQEFDGASTEDVFTQVFPVTERKKQHYVHLNTTKFKLPTHFGFLIDECFDTKSCAALELLPLLLPVRNKKNINAADFIYCAKEEISKKRASFYIHV